MSGTKQASLAETIRHLAGTAPRLAAISAVAAALAVVLPVVDVAAGTGTSIGESGADLAGILAWFVVASFVAAAAARFAPTLAPFCNVLDGIALVLLAVATAWAIVGGPVATDLHQTDHALAALGAWPAGPAGLGAEDRAMADALRAASTVAVTPAPGVLFLCLAPVALLAARRLRGRQARGLRR